MSLLSLRQVSYHLGTRALFENLSLSINSRDRVALVGLNGTGKTSLLKILAGKLEPDGGCLSRRSGAQVEYVPQTLPPALASTTLFDAVADNLRDGYHGAASDYLVEQQLHELRFEDDHYFRTLGELSGGEVNRALLARALAADPDVVLLDEPTNHMDLGAVEAFEQFMLQGFDAAAVVVSHDRRLLDAICTRTMFLRDRTLHAFDLPYTRAKAELAAADAAALSRRSDEEKELARMRTSASKLADWGKNSGNEKFSRRARSMERRIDRLEVETTVVTRAAIARVSLATSAPASQTLVEVRDLAVQRPNGEILFVLERLRVRPGERVAIVGRNGCGKTTLIRQLVAHHRSDVLTEAIRFNPTVRLGYYDQELKHFATGERLSSAVALRCDVQTQRITSELVTAGFPYERHQELVSNLSGGERARLTFLAIYLQRPHLLILDEPTNHLDVDGIECLEHQLIESDSSCIFVSHDREFLERIATRVVVVGKN